MNGFWKSMKNGLLKDFKRFQGISTNFRGFKGIWTDFVFLGILRYFKRFARISMDFKEFLGILRESKGFLGILCHSKLLNLKKFFWMLKIFIASINLFTSINLTQLCTNFVLVIKPYVPTSFITHFFYILLDELA